MEEWVFDDRSDRGGEITARLLNGASLRTFMVPDSSLPSNYPEHMETYNLPHVILNGDFFWGKSDTSHLMVVPGEGMSPRTAFCYTNIGNIFCSYTPENNCISLMSKKRYKTHLWRLRNDYQLIWDSDTDISTDTIREAIENCATFRIAMLDSENVWNIHPVDLPMYYPESKRFVLKTAMDEYPIFFRYPEDTVELLRNYPGFFETKPVGNEHGAIYVEKFVKFCTFYLIESDGTYRNYFDVPRNTVQRYTRLRIFTDSR